MSDQWRIYMCQMGDHRASIAVDVGVAESIESAPPVCARVRLTYKNPDDRGLPTNDEFDAVSALEDDLVAFVAESPGDVFVGRLTAAGTRTFFTYTRRDESEWAQLVGRLTAKSGYGLEYLVGEDPGFTHCRSTLYPSADDWRVILDNDVIDSVNKHGDDGSKPRQIDHWTYFASEAAARPFIDWAVSDRFVFDAEYSGVDEDGRYCVRLHHVGPAQRHEVSRYTLALMRKAAELGGEYDGWETVVLGADDPPAG
jgi:hypothetical protein